MIFRTVLAVALLATYSPAVAAPKRMPDHCMSLALVAEKVMLDRQTGRISARQAIAAFSADPEGQYGRLIAGAWKSPKHRDPKVAADVFAERAYRNCVFS